MGKIVCASRGGEASRQIQRRAIEVAKERNRPLVFLYVVSLSSLGEIDEGLVEAAKCELEWFGRALLETAIQRAQASQVSAEIAIRHGPIQSGIKDFLIESGAEVLVLGRPRSQATNQAFSGYAFSEFVGHLERQTGVEVMVVE